MRLSRLSWLFVLLLVTLASAATASVDKRHEFEAVLGWYFPSDIEVDDVLLPTPHDNPSGLKLEYHDGLSWGFRYGYRFRPKMGLGVTWTHFDLDSSASEANDIGCSACDADFDFADFSFEWYPGAGEWSLYTGLGWASGDFDANFEGDSNDRSISDDAFTWHLGTAYTWRIGESFYLRPDGRIRFLQLDQKGSGKYDSEDPELRLGFGWQF